MIYLDSAATTQPTNEVVDFVTQYIKDKWYNPSALYSKAIKIRSDIDNARKNIANYINADSNEIYFTSGATESNNWVLKGFVDYCEDYDYIPIIIISDVEHNSINSYFSKSHKANVFNIIVNKDGFVDLQSLEIKLKYIENLYKDYKIKILVSIQYANSEIGTIQHIKKIAELAHKYDGIFHTDATQAFGHIPIDVHNDNIDLLSASAQKCGGLIGTGILYKSKKCNCIRPLIYGSQENGERGGTENVLGIMAMSKAVDCCRKNPNVTKIRQLRNYFISELVERFKCNINGWIGDYYKEQFLNDIAYDYRLPNNINVTFPQNITGEALIYMLDFAGIMISSGSACNSHTNKLSPVLKAIGLTDEEIIKTIRITLPNEITKEEIDITLNEIDKAITILTR